MSVNVLTVNANNPTDIGPDPVVDLSAQHVSKDAQLDQELLRIGHEVIALQKQEPVRMALRNHWKGAIWSLFMSMALWMEGFDTSMLGSSFLSGRSLWPLSSPSRPSRHGGSYAKVDTMKPRR